MDTVERMIEKDTPMHKSYQSTLPSSSRLLKKKWDDKYYNEHLLLVRDARPSVDTRPPRTYMHLHMKLKKLQLQEERTETIERDNRILLEKMSNTMRTTGQIDNRNYYEGRSLNQEKRRRELLRLSKENGTMAKRIIDRKPVLAREGWQKSSQQNNVYLNNIAKYEVDWHKPKSTKQQQEQQDDDKQKRDEQKQGQQQDQQQKDKQQQSKQQKQKQDEQQDQQQQDKQQQSKQQKQQKQSTEQPKPEEKKNPPPAEEPKGLGALQKFNPLEEKKGASDKKK